MTDDHLSLTRRRLIASLATISGASAAAGNGTAAYFHDGTESSGNTIQAGTLNLRVGGQEATYSLLGVDNVRPEDSGTSDPVNVKNVGSLSGTLEIELSEIQSEGRGGSPGRLDDLLDIRGELGSSVVIPDTTVSSLEVGDTFSAGTIPAEESEQFTLSWSLQSTNSNNTQGHSIGLAFTFRLVQAGDGTS